MHLFFSPVKIDEGYCCLFYIVLFHLFYKTNLIIWALLHIILHCILVAKKRKLLSRRGYHWIY